MTRSPGKNQESRANKAHSSEGRAPRVPMNSGSKLSVPPGVIKEGHQGYWAVDRPGMIDQMKAAWWEHVTNEMNENITQSGGGGEVMYLMQVEQSYYDEDIAAQQKKNIETTTKEAQKLGAGEYVPKGRDRVTERDII